MRALARLATLPLLLVTASAAALPALRVSPDRHFLMTEDGKPFFWLADTAWELFHRLDREEAVKYLDNRARLGFNVVQAVALAEEDGLKTGNSYGHVPFADPKVPDPLVKDGPDNDYWDHVDFIVDAANARGIYVGFLPTWGKWWQEKCIFTPDSARRYGAWLGRRYRDKGIVWILGGDRRPQKPVEHEIAAAFAAGLREGDGGRHLISYHPRGGGRSSEFYHAADWLDFNMRQNGHEIDSDRYDHTRDDYARTDPVKPVIDAEPVYEGHPVAFNPDRRGHTVAADVRRALWWDLCSGACGHTYGHHSIWQMHASKRSSVTAPDGKNRPLMPWHEAIDEPGAAQMRIAKDLLLAYPYFTRVPAPEMIVTDRIASLVPGAGTRRFAATRDAKGSFALVYAPVGRPFAVDLTRLAGPNVRACWLNPRDGSRSEWTAVARTAAARFVPPTPGELLDWVLVLESRP